VTILYVSPESSSVVRGAAAAILILHISGGSVGILSGAAALVFRKGSRLHRLAGNLFFVSMLTMSAIGAVVSPFLPQPQWGNVVMAVFTFYLVLTGWVTVRRIEGTIGRTEMGAFLLALGAVVASLTFGFQAANSPTGKFGGFPAAGYYVFATIVVLAAAGDLKMILRGGISGAPRITRHLWRMCAALFIASGSFFLGQQKVMPAYMRGSPLLFIPEIAVLGCLAFWLLRTRFSARYAKRQPMRNGA
jgi:hypothetical protein